MTSDKTCPGALCGVCGKPIAKARLRAIPNATLCIRCKRKEDDPLVRAEDVYDSLLVRSEITPSEAQRMTHLSGG